MNIISAFESFIGYAFKYIRILRISDVLDILIVAAAIYLLLMNLKGTRAIQLLKGVAVALALYLLSDILNLTTVKYILGQIFTIATFAICVIFQPELRNLLERVGRLKFGNFIDLAFDTSGGDNTDEIIDEIAEAAVDLSATKTGALIVIERGTRLGEYMNSGTMLDAVVSSELLKNIFVPNTPLHDGAVIIRGGKIITAGCVLPLTANTNLSSELGTRHRAALGLSETSDAVIVVVSEETGKISIALKGALTRNLNEVSLKRALTKLMNVNNQKPVEAIRRITLRKSK